MRPRAGVELGAAGRRPIPARELRMLNPRAGAARIMRGMEQVVELWYWRVTDPVSRRRYVTRYRMTEANALDFDPAAERIEGSLERRVVRNDRQAIATRAGYRRDSVGQESP
jgi:hypothetical protein